jgi:hypothetical protein
VKGEEEEEEGGAELKHKTSYYYKMTTELFLKVKKQQFLNVIALAVKVIVIW